MLTTDIVSPCTSRITYHPSGATISPTGSISCTWRMADLAPGMGVTITLMGVVGPQIVGRQTFVYTARIGGTLGEAMMANKVATVKVVVIGPTVTPTPRRWMLWLSLLWRGR